MARLFARRSEANLPYEDARRQHSAAHYAPALERIHQVFQLRDPRSLLGTERLRELMRIAASCESELGNTSAATEWWVRAKKLARE